MNPKERLIEAFELRQPDKVPTMEIDFQLHEALIGRRLILGKELGVLRPIPCQDDSPHPFAWADRSGRTGAPGRPASGVAH